MSKVNARLAKKVTKEVILSHPLLLDGIKDILTEDLNADVTNMRLRANHEKVANWTEYMADHLATQRTLQNVIDLITIRKD